jgi:pyruvate formate lyase activating enzyme
MEKARFWELEENGIRCTLCPHYCLIPLNKKGRCKQRKNINNVLYSLNYGIITSYAIDPIEKKPLYHFMPGTQIMSFGSSGCNFTCKFCQNHEISLADNPRSVFLSYERLVELTMNENLQSIAFTYNEPTVWYEYMVDTAMLAKSYGLKTVCVTNGFINEKPLRELLKYMDAFNVDLKSYSDEYYRNICGGRLEPVKETIKTISQSKVHLEVTTLVVEGENDDIGNLEELFKWLGALDREIILHLSRYYPAYKMKNPATRVETLLKAKKRARKYLKHVYIGNVPGIS